MKSPCVKTCAHCGKTIAALNEAIVHLCGCPPGNKIYIDTGGTYMSKEDPTELDNDLEERILSIENMLELGRLALMENKHELISTALESAFEKLQYVIDDYCVVS